MQCRLNTFYYKQKIDNNQVCIRSVKFVIIKEINYKLQLRYLITMYYKNL